ncbi:hypothetical protein HBH96_112240 [Parastagonospora nodorum]|nr:hypothetical protein HBH43_065390 [Parastagonospora nodorum]KAH5056702.1 hypothetical protein HBH96_112240 [Parastagonospora nodorum]KAH6310900.1 hypothetical protein HBI39_070750 [Parastagonospora nodorum]
MYPPRLHPLLTHFEHHGSSLLRSALSDKMDSVPDMVLLLLFVFELRWHYSRKRRLRGQMEDDRTGVDVSREWSLCWLKKGELYCQSIETNPSYPR